ncbi:hypothetical protein AMELA_G00255410 [Ameiurus melas]|uniref:Uncharacterized protein n=1 Tax=Ameiurus melas TaxID=219545 RepID=A0A7J5ZT93_AMEME|nr:hypothetical protein AMELA_G00255410 [Ameiurus melas]
MERQETDRATLMTNISLSDFIDPSNMSECLYTSRENDCTLLETKNISSTSHRQSSNINRDEDNINDTEKRKRDESLPIMVLNVSDNQDCSLDKGKEKALCVTADTCTINQRDYSSKHSCSQQEITGSTDLRNSDSEAITDFASSDEVLVQLKIEKDFDLKGSSIFHSDLNQKSVLTDHEMIMLKHGKETSTFMENYSMTILPGHLDELSNKIALESHTAKLCEGLRLCGKKDCEIVYQTAVYSPSAEIKVAPDRDLYQESNSSPLQKLSSNCSIESQVRTGEAPKKRRLETNKKVNNANKDNLSEREIMTASLVQEKDHSYFTAVITPATQIHILPVPETKIQTMISGSLVTDTKKKKSAKSKGPPPPVMKKPKNPFGKDVAHAKDKPRPYSELLQKNIKTGRRESALHHVTEDPHKSHLDLEKKAKMKGPPPPVPKKPLNPFVAIERNIVLPINASISKDTTGTLTRECCDYKPYMHRTVHEEEPKTIFAINRDNFLVTYSNSNTLDENVFLSFRPELVRQTGNAHMKRMQQSSICNVGNWENKVLEMTKTSDVKKSFSCQMERILSPKKGESLFIYLFIFRPFMSNKKCRGVC